MVRIELKLSFRTRTWKPFTFQKSTWKAYENGKVAWIVPDIIEPEDYAVWAPALIEWINEQKKGELPKRAPALRVLWLTPLRALVKDTTRTLEELSNGIDLPWTI